MSLKFNSRGYLAKTDKISFVEFKNVFVKNMPFYKRPLIFIEFNDFLIEISKILEQESFEIWIDGSFVTDEIEPKDIDFVIFLENISNNLIDKIYNLMKGFYYLDVYFVFGKANILLFLYLLSSCPKLSFFLREFSRQVQLYLSMHL